MVEATSPQIPPWEQYPDAFGRLVLTEAMTAEVQKTLWAYVHIVRGEEAEHRFRRLVGAIRSSGRTPITEEMSEDLLTAVRAVRTTLGKIRDEAPNPSTESWEAFKRINRLDKIERRVEGVRREKEWT